MKRYKTQWAFAKQISQPSIYSNEQAARDDVTYLLGNWLVRNLHSHINAPDYAKKGSAEFEESLRYIAREIPQLISENKVWEAYDLWEDFYLRFQNEFGYPLFLALGTVIVEGSKETGLKNRVPLLEVTEESPLEKYGKGHKFVQINPVFEIRDRAVIEAAEVAQRKADLKGITITPEQFEKAVEDTMRAMDKKYSYLYRGDEQKLHSDIRQGILDKLFPRSSIGLGALKRWLVQYADMGGAWHPGRHMNEAHAREQAREYLEVLHKTLGKHIEGQKHIQGSEKYIGEATAFRRHLRNLLEHDYVWAAYLDLKQFQEDWSTGLYFPLELSMGTMRVIPEPERESGSYCPGSAC
jgi:hypothetical protein